MNIRSLICVMICGVGIVRWGQVKRCGPWERLQGFWYRPRWPPAEMMRPVDKRQFFSGGDRTGQCECFFSYLKIKYVFFILEKKRNRSEIFLKSLDLKPKGHHNERFGTALYHHYQNTKREDIF